MSQHGNRMSANPIRGDGQGSFFSGQLRTEKLPQVVAEQVSYEEQKHFWKQKDPITKVNREPHDYGMFDSIASRRESTV